MEKDSQGFSLINQMVTETQIFDILHVSLIEDKELSDKPIIFLFDEYHHDGESIEENISIADDLINKGIIEIIGIECYQTKREFSNKNHLYDPFKVGECLEFPTHIKSTHPDLVIIGIDDSELMNRIEEDIYNENISPPENPLQEERSMLFINTLLQEMNTRSISRNAILNAGSRHNVDIMNFVRKNEIKLLKGLNYSFVRIRAESHPEKSSP